MESNFEINNSKVDEIIQNHLDKHLKKNYYNLEKPSESPKSGNFVHKRMDTFSNIQTIIKGEADIYGENSKNEVVDVEEEEKKSYLKKLYKYLKRNKNNDTIKKILILCLLIIIFVVIESTLVWIFSMINGIFLSKYIITISIIVS